MPKYQVFSQGYIYDLECDRFEINEFCIVGYKRTEPSDMPDSVMFIVPGGTTIVRVNEDAIPEPQEEKE